MGFSDTWKLLDEEKIYRAIGSLRFSFDEDAARECVYFAAHRWLERDLEAFRVESLEETNIIDGFKFVTDMRGAWTGKGSAKVQEGKSYRPRNFSTLANKKFILDWKTTKSTLDSDWQDRYIDSWQWRHYLAFSGAETFIYRGIRRRSQINGDLETKEIIIHASEDPNLIRASQNQIKQIKGNRDNLIQLGITPWPMNKPGACHKYGYDCPYINDCWAGNPDDRVLDKDHPVSYSRMEDFMLCPERFRRNALASRDAIEGEEQDISESSNFGSAVHRGLQEVYKQAFKL